LEKIPLNRAGELKVIAIGKKFKVDYNRISQITTDKEMEKIRRHERTGRPLGSECFVEKIETALDRLLKPGKPGPKGRQLSMVSL
jgi:hypothetical protein